VSITFALSDPGRTWQREAEVNLSRTTLIKRPDWARTYRWDFSDFAEIEAGQTLTGTPTVTATPSGLTLGSPAISGAYVTCAVSAGTADYVYDLTATVTTSGGATLSIVGKLAVEE